MLSYCITRANGLVYCGYGSDPTPTIFTLEKVGSTAAGVAIDFDADTLYLKSGGKYCR